MHYSDRTIKVCVLQIVWRRFGAYVFFGVQSSDCTSFLFVGVVARFLWEPQQFQKDSNVR